MYHFKLYYLKMRFNTMLNKVSSYIINTLIKVKILPSWFILIFDLLLVELVSFGSLIFLKLISHSSYKDLLLYYLLFNLIVFFFVFLLFKTSRSIVRYSSYDDVLKIINSVLSSFFILSISNYFLNYRYDIYFISTFFIAINCFLILLVLITFRIFVKYFFQLINSRKSEDSVKDRIVIIGVNRKNISLLEMLSLPSSNFSLIAFFDINRTLHKKKIAGIPVISDGKSVITHLRAKNVKNIIIAKNYFDEEYENILFDYCLQNNIKIFKPELLQKSNPNDLTNFQEYKLEELLFRKTIEIENPNIIRQFSNKVVLVTGGAGSIGSELAKQIVAFNPSKLIIVDQAETPLHEVELFFNKNLSKSNCVFELIDVTNYDELALIFELHQPDIVFHAAAYKHVPILEKNFKQAIKVNVFGTKKCLDLAIKHDVEKFIFVSTDKAVNPTNIMGASKRIAELIAQNIYNSQKSSTKLEIMITRFGNVLGSNGSVVHLFKQQIAEGGPVTVTHPEVTRFFMTIPEACKLVIEAAAIGNGGNIYVFDMGKSIKIVDLAEKMIRLAGKVPGKDISIHFSGMRPGEKLYEEVLTECSETQPTYNPKIVIAKEKSDLVNSLDQIMDTLKDFNSMDREEVVNSIKKLVPEYQINSTQT
ncbi:MAG: polysaccharide biosynthesis protein [Flavobacteriia bacterium]|nr:MAG: polysaccharide biosynthesis protein [Flavobacteriia bacterium]